MKVAIIGAGNMGGSIACGLAKGKLIPASDIIVSNPSIGKLEALKKEFPSIAITRNNAEAATGADIVILAVKPWLIRGVLREMKLRSKQILVSVAAGISFEQLAHDVVEPEMPMFRIVPNTAISELQSMTLIASRNAGQELEALMVNLFSEMGMAAAKINSFIWDVYCDWFIEIAKPRLNSGDAEQADTARRVLVYVLDKALKLLHPFMPFVTEELYQALPGSAETIMTQAWPTVDEAHNWPEEEEAFEKVMDYIKAVRTMRTEMNVHPAKKTSMIIETADATPFQNAQVYLAKFAFATEVTFTAKYEGSTDGMVQVSTHAARGFIPMMELIDREKELARLNKEKAKAEKELAMFENQLNNPKFVERAPAALVEDIRAKHAKSQDKLANIEQSIQALG